MTCDSCGKPIKGSGFSGSAGGNFCSDACRSDAQIEVAAQLLAAQMDKQDRK